MPTVKPFFFFQAEDGIRDRNVTGVQTCALPIYCGGDRRGRRLEGPDPAPAADLADHLRNELGLERPGTWKPWFPVIDFARCTNCMRSEERRVGTALNT